MGTPGLMLAVATLVLAMVRAGITFRENVRRVVDQVEALEDAVRSIVRWAGLDPLSTTMRTQRSRSASSPRV